MKWLKRLLFLIFLGFSLGLAAVTALYFYFAPQLPDVTTLRDVQLQTPMRVFSADGELISQFGEKRRIPLQIDEVPEQMLQAFLATEDARFYSHPGIDPIGITRAAVNLIATGEKSQGASTITQQVARNFFLTREKTYIRKIKEIFLAIKIEQELSKDEILALYLNKIPLGYRSFGVGAAAQVYYGKTVDQLTLPQIAVIAGLPKAPSALNPIRSPERARDRRRVVLGRMLETGYIDQASFDEANQAPITATYHGAEISLAAPYLAEMVRQQILEQFGEDAYTTGMDVYTTVTAKRQNAATDALRTNLKSYDQRHGFRGAIKQLWKDQEPALSQEDINKQLASLPNYGVLRAAAVISTTDNSANILVKGGKLGVIAWDDMKWARRFITDTRQGPAPKLAGEILSAGDVVWVEAIADNLDTAGKEASDSSEPENQPLASSYSLSQLPDAGAALIAISPLDGAVEALVGGFSFNQSKFNRVTQASRQVGSNIKPFLYSAAFEQGMTLATLENDAPINRWDKAMGVAWRPKNSPPVYDGPIRLRVALAQSKNVVSVRLMRDLGIDAVIKHLAKFGFPANELPRNESLSLGSASLTPMQVASAYGSFANGGYLVSPYFIDRIEDGEGNIIFQQLPKVACDSCFETIEHAPSLDKLLNVKGNPLKQCDISFAQEDDLAPRIISAENAFLVSQAMNSAVWGGGSWAHKTGWNGTGWRAAKELKRRDIAGKTGTTNDAKDAWFSGFSPDLVVTSWIGFDDFNRELGEASYNANLDKNQVTGKEFGARTAQPAWIDFMKVGLEGVPEQAFTPPKNVSTVRIDRTTGLLTKSSDHTTRFEYFENGTEPKEYVKPSSGSVFDSEEEELF
ncbi:MULTISPECIES: penicillin-binding protein 1A [unclassified Agarivorans]|uniref:penicillin-binding protein 1A n=1 Tax=unclassified Agarivorans TaxID=2636026 RepID=UPI0026E3E0E4|nr:MULTISPECIES: PBP1A family penicillin-binding protein [unclassified Agarivorans]MDO6686795.1 PBP1A family penicillin-binding protein [Agarivorans sp. 3_MG-2023]MDO6716475.1 PBP1A family penicillin-binding protein [Agarivorans sp. 2_MG-2023]